MVSTTKKTAPEGETILRLFSAKILFSAAEIDIYRLMRLPIIILASFGQLYVPYQTQYNVVALSSATLLKQVRVTCADVDAVQTSIADTIAIKFSSPPVLVLTVLFSRSGTRIFPHILTPVVDGEAMRRFGL